MLERERKGDVNLDFFFFSIHFANFNPPPSLCVGDSCIIMSKSLHSYCGMAFPSSIMFLVTIVDTCKYFIFYF